MRILVVANVFPWPETTGARMRLANVVRGLSRIGEVDLFVSVHPSRPGPFLVPRREPVARVDVAVRPSRRPSTGDWIRWLAGTGLPTALLGHDHRTLASRYRRWALPRYDIIWFARVDSYVGLRECARSSIIVDVDDLEEHKVEGALAVDGEGMQREPAGVSERWRTSLRRFRASRDVACWRRLMVSVAAEVDAVIVCSDLDRRRLGAVNTEVVPNGYIVPVHPLGRATVGDPPTITFPGLLTYAPNVDAAHVLARRIAPRVWDQVPQAQIRLVGTPNRGVRSLHAPPRVVVTGFVEDIEEELGRADVIAVPLRFGGGTRIKILEAFAHRIPVVSTSKGVEGLEAADGQELLVRDAPEAFASACVQLLTDQPTRGALVEAAYRRFHAKYRWDDIQGHIAALAVRVAASRRTVTQPLR
ncbi:MAG: glycosyltransferase [Armatimonadota bacterium]